MPTLRKPPPPPQHKNSKQFGNRGGETRAEASAETASAPTMGVLTFRQLGLRVRVRLVGKSSGLLAVLNLVCTTLDRGYSACHPVSTRIHRIASPLQGEPPCPERVEGVARGKEGLSFLRQVPTVACLTSSHSTVVNK